MTFGWKACGQKGLKTWGKTFKKRHKNDFRCQYRGLRRLEVRKRPFTEYLLYYVYWNDTEFITHCPFIETMNRFVRTILLN